MIPPDIQPSHPIDFPDDEVREKLLELLGLTEVPAAVDFTSEALEESQEGIRSQTISYANSLGETVPGILMTPLDRAADAIPGVVCVSGTGGSAQRVAEHFYRSEDGTLIGWGRELARRGFCTLAISAKGTLERRASIDDWAMEMKLLAPYGRSQMGVLAEETLMAARVLQSVSGVDTDRIGLTGMSLGGNAAWYAMACAPWIAAGVAVCGGVGSLAESIHHGDPHRHSAYFYVPHMLRYFDHARVVAQCMPPRPFLMISPTRDEDMPRSGVEALRPVVASAYEACGHADRFSVRQPDGNHQFREEYFEWMAAWFERFLIRKPE
ncbi:MAG: hypothetical protein VX733_01395 [Candidatus Latescibacterota bacterium]|nr:hypothetical protein [Candidatus Latescibacterota bacterium]